MCYPLLMERLKHKRPLFKTLKNRLKRPRQFIQCLLGPRQTGKTTLIQQILKTFPTNSFLYFSADDPATQSHEWIRQKWLAARFLEAQQKKDILLVFDEIQKINAWSDVVKSLWDEDTRKKTKIKVAILGSSPLLLQKGLTESLAGRFEVLRLGHWSFTEMKKVFNFGIDEYIYYGAYPGAASLISDEKRWRDYVINSLAETVLLKDILLHHQINKPALLRQLYALATQYSGQILSFHKMLGQLHDAGNTTTLAHYLELLSIAGLVSGLQKFSANTLRKRLSSPKLQIQNTALMTSSLEESFQSIKKTSHWGRIVESCVGAHLWNLCFQEGGELYYWNEQSKEVDFVLKKNNKTIAIEVKSGHKARHLKSLESFRRKHKPNATIVVAGEGIPLEKFLEMRF